MSHPFNFPYTPYPVQLELMTAIHDCLESGSVGCFESPTGTGKSLSTICSALHWLVQEEQRVLTSKPVESTPTADNDDWLASFTTDSDSQQKEKEIKAWGDAKMEYDAMKKRVAASKNATQSSSYIIPQHHHTTQESEKDEFLLVSDTKEEESDEDEEAIDQHYGDVLKLPQIYYCSRTHSQLAQFIAEARKTIHKNIRCVTLGSRKNLCVNEEVRKLKTESGISERCLELQKEKGSSLTQSKKTNDDANNGTGKARKVASGPGCSYRNKQNESRLADYGLREVIDLEDLMAVASGTGSAGSRPTSLPPACPYYASRKAMKHAQLVCLPYNLLLHSELRKSVGLNIENKVVIVDEAHNLVEAINQMYSAEVSPQDLDTVIQAIGAYVGRYQMQLSSANVQNLNVLLSCVRKMRQNAGRVLSDRTAAHQPSVNGSAGAEESVASVALTVNDFLFSVSADNTNLTKLTHFITASNLTEKVSGFYSKKLSETVTDATAAGGGSVITSFRSVIRLLQCLSNQDSDGKVILKQILSDKSSVAVGVSVSYVLLNPSTFFTPLVEQARSVILLGGTLQPFSHVLSNLFPWSLGGTSPDVGVVTSAQGVVVRQCGLPSGAPKALHLFSCGHVVKSSHVKVVVVTKGASGQPMQFTADQRMSVTIVNDLLEVLCGLARVVPGGMVVFFTSYAYMETVVARWKSNNGAGLSRLTQLKSLFIERPPRATGESKSSNSSSSSSHVWEDYCRQIKLSAHASGPTTNGISTAGAILFSVIGGSLSEGINFSDALARCVVVVGMPYPDQRDVVMQQKMQFANKQQQQSSRGSGANSNQHHSSDAGSRLLDTMCMKAVNQSIGRSIRHANDYASIVLVDRRYGEPRVSAQLPGWIRSSVEVWREPFKSGGSNGEEESGAGVLGGLSRFYVERAGK